MIETFSDGGHIGFWARPIETNAKRDWAASTVSVFLSPTTSDTISGFVFATLGQTEKGAEDSDGLILNAHAQLAVDGKTVDGEFKGSVTTVYTHPLSQGGASNSYGGEAEAYMNGGEGMGKAMAELMKTEQKDTKL